MSKRCILAKIAMRKEEVQEEEVKGVKEEVTEVVRHLRFFRLLGMVLPLSFV